MERKRRLPARAARVESASKKRTSTPPEQRNQTPPTPTAPPPAVEESLPKSIAAGKPLPTLDEPQPDNLSSKEFQSISESGVLAESLQRSRAKWLSEGIFEKYWTKPTKKKGAPDLTNNPAKDTMTKLGTCTITVEPHIFDAVMYAIKDPNPRPVPPVSQQPMYRPIIQYGPQNGMLPPPPPAPILPPSQQKQFSPTQPTPQAPQTAQDTSMKNSTSPAPHTAQDTSMKNSTSRSSLTNTPHTSGPPANGTVPNGHPPHNPQQSPSVASAAPAGKSTDPVIQMLAERAATDPDLKALMRIVANGEASPDELKKFQSHIDDLTRLQKARQAAAQPPQSGNQPPPPPSSATPQINGQANSRPTQSPAASPAPARTAPTPSAPTPHYQAQPQALRSKGPLPPTKPDISGVVFEFSGGSGDRFLFPKFSILEYLPGGQVIASFLIVRKGSSSDSPTYDPKLDYYQPITIRLYAHQGRQLDALQKVVAPPDEVRRYMDDIMDNMTRAEYVLLAMRLPRDGDPNNAAEKEAEAEKANQVDNQVLWATTNPTPPPKPKPVEKPPTEAEQYRNFISSVS